MGCSDSLSLGVNQNANTPNNVISNNENQVNYYQNIPNYENNLNNEYNTNNRNNAYNTSNINNVSDTNKANTNNRNIGYNVNNSNNRNIAYNTNNNPVFETDDFEDEDYPVFQPNFYEKYIQNIKKTYNDWVYENNEEVIKIHRIYISLNFKENKTTVIEIEKLACQNYKKHLKKQIINGCSLDNVKPLLEKYNSIFKIDSSRWYQVRPTTDIYIMSEKTNEDEIQSFQVFYEKDTSKVNFYKTNIDYGNTNTSNGVLNNLKPDGVVKKYNDLKSEFIDRHPEKFNY